MLVKRTPPGSQRTFNCFFIFHFANLCLKYVPARMGPLQCNGSANKTLSLQSMWVAESACVYRTHTRSHSLLTMTAVLVALYFLRTRVVGNFTIVADQKASRRSCSSVLAWSAGGAGGCGRSASCSMKVDRRRRPRSSFHTT